MWCAGPAPGWSGENKATVTQWAATDGTFHRKIVINDQPGLTPEALIWYTSGLSTPVVTWEGRVSLDGVETRAPGVSAFSPHFLNLERG